MGEATIMTENVPAIVEEKASTIALVNRALVFQVVTIDDRREAEVIMADLMEREKFWDKLTGHSKATSYEAYLAARALHDDPITELQDARLNKSTGLKQRVIAWDAERERERAEEQRRLEKIARKQAEEEQLAAAIAAHLEGDDTSADAILSEPLFVPPVFVPKPDVKPSRLTAGRSHWEAEVVSLAELVRAVAAGAAPITFIEANMVTLNAQARAARQAMKVPGVLAVERQV